MKRFLEKIALFLEKILPSPFSLAVLLTVFTAFLSLFFIPDSVSIGEKLLLPATYFTKGIWDLLSFAMQMMLILVLGHVLALTPAVKRLIELLTKQIKTNASAALFVSFFTVALAFLNWGLGLIFGAIFAREVAGNFQKNSKPLNYPLIAAAGYSGLMIWHGGLSGSAPLKIAEPGHFLADKIGVISIDQTLFSPMNIAVTIAALILIPLFFYFFGKIKFLPTTINLSEQPAEKTTSKPAGMEKIDFSRWFSVVFALFLFAGLFYSFFFSNAKTGINLNIINLFLLASGLLLHKNVHNFLTSVTTAIKGASGILIQFPIYAGIMGIMKYSGLLESVTNAFISISTAHSFSYFTFLIAGIVNFFVPSGGGQWAVQGPVIVEAAQQLHVAIPKAVMALAYGDQLTNMMQPFWALPLLGITGLKAKQIFPYTFLLMLLGFIIFSVALLIF